MQQPERQAGGLSTDARRAQIEPMDPRITSIQPGGGTGMSIELAWGHVRRWWLKTFRSGYVRRMASLRRGSTRGCPHEILDPRDVKYYRNVCDCRWEPGDDPFSWRDKLPFARSGLAELILFEIACLAAGMVLGFVFWPAALLPAVFGLFFLWFFRNPRRQIPDSPGLIVSPADGTVVTVEELDRDEYIGGPVVLIGIFLSVFNVHVNRSPVRSRVVGLHYHPGKFLNALRAISARENERLELRLEESEAPYRRLVVRQIAGALARRIVCWLKPGDELARGELFGMIKLGSRTELVLPREPGLRIEVKPGQKVHGGSSILARYTTDPGRALDPPGR